MTSVAKGLTKPRSVYDPSNTTVFYVKFCHGDCSEGLRTSAPLCGNKART